MKTLRETIEAAIIVSVLLGLVESLVTDKAEKAAVEDVVNELDETEKKRIIKRMRWMIWGGELVFILFLLSIFPRLYVTDAFLMISQGALAGLFIALCIGAAFIAVVSLNP